MSVKNCANGSKQIRILVSLYFLVNLLDLT